MSGQNLDRKPEAKRTEPIQKITLPNELCIFIIDAFKKEFKQYNNYTLKFQFWNDINIELSKQTVAFN
ncbi:hypothetical protein [Metabacillus fastidiosus]|uniref:hypothetical protein n=1 Tax=Metabacillus fastidiosus TaxID=1458 RepID=UPI003D26EC65